MNISCSAVPCPILLSSKCVIYEGANLLYTGINTNNTLQTSLEKIDAIIGTLSGNIGAGTILQTDLVFPGDGISSYIFPELIGRTVLKVFRGTGTILRVHSTVADNEYAQFNSVTGEIIVSFAFSAAEGLWVEYKTT